MLLRSNWSHVLKFMSCTTSSIEFHVIFCVFCSEMTPFIISQFDAWWITVWRATKSRWSASVTFAICYGWWFRNPAITTWDVQHLVNSGINYQPQLVQNSFHHQYQLFQHLIFGVWPEAATCNPTSGRERRSVANVKSFQVFKQFVSSWSQCKRRCPRKEYQIILNGKLNRLLSIVNCV